MRKRRLHRYTQPWPTAIQPRAIPNHQAELDIKRQYEDHLRSQNSPESRLQRAREIAQQKHEMALRAEIIAAQQERARIARDMAVARRAAYEQGFLAGAYSGQSVKGFGQGQEGHRNETVPASPIVNEESLRRKVVEEMLESCRVIAESNPNMDSASFLKAVKQRSKKIL